MNYGRINWDYQPPENRGLNEMVAGILFVLALVALLVIMYCNDDTGFRQERSYMEAPAPEGK